MKHSIRRRRRRRSQIGFTMIEVMVALLLTAIAASGIIGLFMVQTRASGYSRHSTEATMLAQDEMERLRATNATALTATTTGLNEYGQVGGIFTRQVTVGPNSGHIDMIVVVSWNEDGVARNVTLRSKKNQ